MARGQTPQQRRVPSIQFRQEAVVGREALAVPVLPGGDRGTLLAKVAELGSVIAVLKAENQALRDEVARLKGLPP